MNFLNYIMNFLNYIMNFLNYIMNFLNYIMNFLKITYWFSYSFGCYCFHNGGQVKMFIVFCFVFVKFLMEVFYIVRAKPIETLSRAFTRSFDLNEIIIVYKLYNKNELH